MSKKLSSELSEIKELAEEYNQWLHEGRQVVRAEIGMESKRYPTVEKAFKDIFNFLPEDILRPYEGDFGEGIYEAIFKGELTFEKARETVIRIGDWDAQVKVQAGSGEETTLSFKDIIEGKDFHRLIEELQGLKRRESIKTLRDKQAKFLEKAQLILKEVS